MSASPYPMNSTTIPSVLLPSLKNDKMREKPPLRNRRQPQKKTPAGTANDKRSSYTHEGYFSGAHVYKRKNGYAPLFFRRNTCGRAERLPPASGGRRVPLCCQWGFRIFSLVHVREERTDRPLCSASTGLRARRLSQMGRQMADAIKNVGAIANEEHNA